MIKEGSFLKFMPPTLDGRNIAEKKRYMLILKNDEENNTIEMLNVSSIKGKEAKLLYDSNISICNYNPLPVPTFVKLDSLYIIDKFNGLEKYISFNGQTLAEEELNLIKEKRYEYISNNCNKVYTINYSEVEFKKLNNCY